MVEKRMKYVIGVDGGGTKTTAALADSQGKILKRTKSGSSSPRNIGIEKAVENIIKVVESVLKFNKGEIISTFIGLPALEEEYKEKKNQIKKEILKRKEISPVFKGKITIGSDQLVSFSAATDKTDGVLIISGTGCVVHGWKQGKEEKASGWGWLADEGSAFWAGQKAFQEILKDLDGRGRSTLLTEMAFKKFKVKTIEDLLKKVYTKNPTEVIPLFSIFCGRAGRKGDKKAKDIMEQAGKELALAGITVIKKLGFKNSKFPIVLAGSMFKSDVFLNAVKKGIKENAPFADFILLKKDPVRGAVKLALKAVNP